MLIKLLWIILTIKNEKEQLLYWSTVSIIIKFIKFTSYLDFKNVHIKIYVNI
jgi:hypothetical protein